CPVSLPSGAFLVESPPMIHRAQVGSVIAKTAITLAVLAYAASLTDLHMAAQKLLAISPGYFVLAFSLFLAIPLIGGLRWWLVLGAIGKARGLAPLTLLFPTAMIVGQMLPLAAGDGVRALLATRRGYRLSDAVNSIFLERVSMMLALLLVVIGTEPLLTK